MGVLEELGGPTAGAIAVAAPGSAEAAAYRALRHDAFVAEQGLFEGDDLDAVDDDPRTVVLVALDGAGGVVGGVRLHPAPEAGDAELAWWAGSRLVCRPGAPPGTGGALVRAACATAEGRGALRFDACVQARYERFFTRLGWVPEGADDRYASPHVRMRWPIDRIQRLADHKRVIGEVWHAGGAPPTDPSPTDAAWLGGPWRGDDGVPLPGSDLVAATDAILPSMVERDPWWAGWCGVLVNLGDLAAMGATPVGLLDALAAPTTSLARRVAAGLRAAADAWGVPVLGGHTQIGAPASLAVTAVGRTAAPVPGAGGRPGMDVCLVVDVAGGWRPGYVGRQWDSTTSRSPAELRAQVAILAAQADAGRVAAAKDVSMAGLVGTLAMLAEASGCGAELDVAAIPRPAGADLADWLTCFPGFALVVATAPGDLPEAAGAPVEVARCGRLVPGSGVQLRWPDGRRTAAVAGPVTGLHGPAEHGSGAQPPPPSPSPTLAAQRHGTAPAAPRPAHVRDRER